MVEPELEIVYKNADEKNVLSFLELAGQSVETFRYFKTRDVAVIKNHYYTCIMEEKGQIIGYGHLEEEGGKNWLGMALVANATGKGRGKKLLKHLFKKAQELNLKETHLTVDNTNFVALEMYRKYGFELEAKLNKNVSLLRRSVEK